MLLKIQNDNKKRYEQMIENQLSRTEVKELDDLRQQMSESNGGGWGHPGDPDFDSLAPRFNFEAPSDGEQDEDEDVIAGLNMPHVTSRWADRLATEDKAWHDQLPQLCDAYMSYCAGTAFPSCSADCTGSGLIDIQCIAPKGETTQTFTVFGSDVGPNTSLLRSGYLAPTPSRPTIAFSLEILDTVYAVQRRSPLTSTESMAKAFCDLRNVPYVHHHRTQLSSAMDAYMLIRRTVQDRLNEALGKNTLDHELKNCCPSCMYKLEEEPALPVDMHVTCDGNDSLKRVATAGLADKRQFHSKYYISAEEVDHFKDEVARSRSRKSKDGEAAAQSECEKRWKNASADKKNGRPKPYFEETGVFVSMCRHSFVLTICDMIKSGELKYVGATTAIKEARQVIERSGLSQEELENCFEQEKSYLSSYKSTPPSVGFATRYIKLLKQLEDKRAELDSISTPSGSNPGRRDIRRDLLTAQTETKRQALGEQLMFLFEAVAKLEVDNNVSERWQPMSAEWINAHALLNNQEFYKCLDELEQLLVRRVIERSKANMPGTGYQMRMNVNKSITSRSKPIKRLIKRFNAIAAAMSPPVPQISWDEVSDVSVLSDLHILRGSQRGIYMQPWTLPLNRQAVNQYHRLLRAEEEIARLNIEIRRLATFISDEESSLPLAVEKIRNANSALGWFAERTMVHRLATNQLLWNELELIKQLPEYSGWHSTGVRLGTSTNNPSAETSAEFTPAPQCNLSHDRPREGQSDRQGATSPHPDNQSQSQPGMSEAGVTEDLEVDEMIVQQFAQWQGLKEQLVWNSEDEDSRSGLEEDSADDDRLDEDRASDKNSVNSE
ncbi:hypothetical protein RhiLY_08386 [Ceratobasidium sp. AG-Ba]|nr:hypothetical protein RhiLY_08386 [Ceratobasidium sp. AG-Ba]